MGPAVRTWPRASATLPPLNWTAGAGAGSRCGAARPAAVAWPRGDAESTWVTRPFLASRDADTCEALVLVTSAVAGTCVGLAFVPSVGEAAWSGLAFVVTSAPVRGGIVLRMTVVPWGVPAGEPIRRAAGSDVTLDGMPAELSTLMGTCVTWGPVGFRPLTLTTVLNGEFGDWDRLTEELVDTLAPRAPPLAAEMGVRWLWGRMINCAWPVTAGEAERDTPKDCVTLEVSNETLLLARDMKVCSLPAKATEGEPETAIGRVMLVPMGGTPRKPDDWLETCDGGREVRTAACELDAGTGVLEALDLDVRGFLAGLGSLWLRIPLIAPRVFPTGIFNTVVLPVPALADF